MDESIYRDIQANESKLELPERKDISADFVTKDLYLAAAILALKFGKLENVDRRDMRHMRFYFSGAGMNEIQSAWTNRTLQVNAAEYADSIRKMKSVIHSED